MVELDGSCDQVLHLSADLDAALEALPSSLHHADLRQARLLRAVAV
jgi:hypothetical protein